MWGGGTSLEIHCCKIPCADILSHLRARLSLQTKPIIVMMVIWPLLVCTVIRASASVRLKDIKAVTGKAQSLSRTPSRWKKRRGAKIDNRRTSGDKYGLKYEPRALSPLLLRNPRSFPLLCGANRVHC